MADVTRVNIRDINPLEHITSDIAKTRTNYESILNGLVTWSTTDNPNVTVRLSTDNYPYFVDYTFPSRSGSLSKGTQFGKEDLHAEYYDYDDILDAVAAKGDEVTLRLTVDTDRDINGEWRLFALATVYEESGMRASRKYVAGSFIWENDAGKRHMYAATADIEEGDELKPDSENPNVRDAVFKWDLHEYETYDDIPGLVAYPPSNNPLSDSRMQDAYVLTGESINSAPGQMNKWLKIAKSNDLCNANYVYDRGSMYLYADPDHDIDPAVYMYIGESRPTSGNNEVKPYRENGTLDLENWYGPIMLIPVGTFTTSQVLHHVAPTDLDGYILRSESNDIGSVNVLANVMIREGSSEPHKGLKIFDTSNYVQWPENTQQIWHDGVDYSDSSSYTAKMVFHHATEDTKTCNVINYDGPDLDDGLSIYLPADDIVSGDAGEDVVVEAKDGAMIEFMFRIWPNASLNGAGSPDLIINKAQIYVLTATRPDELDTAQIIAKFSMARLTNFYLWAENVAVPNRPVFYKAKFVYSAQDREWKTYDYYQIPDHVFLSPKGFVDPSVRNSAEGDTYGEDGAYSGVQTAGFPLMQDPFGGMDLGAIRLNRIEHNE